MRVQYRPRALADIDEIFRYLETRSPVGASNVLQAIYASVRSIAENPYAWQATDDPQIRAKIVSGYSYMIFYTILEHDTVEIMHVRHASRRPWVRQT